MFALLGGFNLTKDKWKFQQPDWFDKQQRIIENFNKSMKIWDNLDASFSNMQKLENITANITSLQPLLRESILIDNKSGVLKSLDGMQKVLSDIRIPSVVDLMPSIEKILPVLDYTWEMPTIDWDWVNDNINSSECYYEETLEEILTEDVREEINESVQEIVLSSGSQKNLEEKYVEWKNRHPLFSELFLQLFYIIMGIIITSAANWIGGVLTNPSNVYEEPKASSNVVVNINIDQSVTIVNEAPYYYKVTFTDDKTGKDITGYVYKKNIELLN